MGAGKGEGRPSREQNGWRVEGKAGQTEGTGWVKDMEQVNLRKQSELRTEGWPENESRMAMSRHVSEGKSLRVGSPAKYLNGSVNKVHYYSQRQKEIFQLGHKCV